MLLKGENIYLMITLSTFWQIGNSNIVLKIRFEINSVNSHVDQDTFCVMCAFPTYHLNFPIRQCFPTFRKMVRTLLFNENFNRTTNTSVAEQ